jgi:ribosome-associated protein
MTGPLRVNSAIVIPEDELIWRFSRSSGPGGQGVNTADSRVQLRWNIATSSALSPDQRARLLARLSARLIDEGVLQVTSSEQRSQRQNRESAERRLADIVAAALAPPPRARRPTKPTRGSVERRIAGKRRRSDVKRLRRETGD